MTNKHEAMLQFIAQCPEVADLFLNFSTSENGDTVIDTIETESEVASFIDGSRVRWYDFALVQYQPISTDPNTDDNAEAMFEIEKVAAWLEEQERKRNYPDFGTECQISELSVLQSTPTVAGKDQRGAKYMMACRIEYFEKKKEQ